MTVAHPSGNLAERICAWGIDSPDKVAIDEYGDVWTFRRLADDIDSWAGRLHQNGLRAVDTVLRSLPQTAEVIAAYFGVMRCGAVPSFMPLPSPKQVHSYCCHSHANLLRLIQPAAIL